MSKNIMINILKEIELYPELAKAFGSLTDEHKSKFLTAMRTMNRGMLYSSPIHGEYHSEKVTLFCVLLGVKLGCTNKELDILIDAGRYHDFMRESDREDTFHGLGAANNIERAIPRGRYTPAELSILKSIMDYHSTDTRIHDYESIAENHDVESKDMERGKLLAYILRDADALDRCRFSKESTAYLKPEFLAYPESLDLIRVSEEINEAYLGKMFTDAEILANPYLHKINSSCLHSIGKNVFRLNSVLEHGLLSYSRFRQIDPSFQRNFDGGNSDKWISVVPTSQAIGNEGASKEFLQHGIVFLFDKTDLYYPDKSVTSSYARSYGLPYTKNAGYSDERYAFDYIPKDKIIGIKLDRKLASQDLATLDHYVYDSFKYELFEKNVKSYLERMGLIENGELPLDIQPMMQRYKEVADEALVKLESSLLLQDMYAEKLLKLSRGINQYIGMKLSEYYRRLLNIPEGNKVTINDAVRYELSISNYDYEQLPDENILYYVTPKQKGKKRETYL